MPRARCPWVPGRDVWYADEVPRQPSTCEVRPLPCSVPGRAAGDYAASPGGALRACVHRSAAASRAGGLRGCRRGRLPLRGCGAGPAAEAGRPAPVTCKAGSVPARKGAWRRHAETR